MSEKKTTLRSLRNIDWKTVEAETGKINELLTHISTNNMTELNKLISAWAKLVWEKKSVFSERTRIETRNLDGNLDWNQR